MTQELHGDDHSGQAPGDGGHRVHPAAGPRVLADTQLGLLAAEMLLRVPHAYTVVSGVQFQGPLQRDALVSAVWQTLARHDALSWHPYLGATYELEAEGGYTAGRVSITEVVLPSSPGITARSLVLEHLAAQRQRVYDVLDANSRPYVNMAIFRSADQDDADGSGFCVLTTHHIFVDEHSVTLLWNEIFRRAAGSSVPPEYDMSYADWAAGTRTEAALHRAATAADELARHLELATGRLSHTAGSGGIRHVPISAESATEIIQTARSWGVPPSAIYGRAVMEAVAPRLTQPTAACSLVVSRRASMEERSTVGCFVSSVPVVADGLEQEVGTESATKRWSDAVAFSAARAHAAVDLLYTSGRSRPEISLAFDAPARTRRTATISWESLPLPDSPSKTPLAFFVAPPSQSHDGELRILWKPGFLEPHSADEMAARFLHSLEVAAGR